MKKPKTFEGMKVPVTVIVDSDTKKYEIEIGIPSAAAINHERGRNHKRVQVHLELNGQETLQWIQFSK